MIVISQNGQHVLKILDPKMSPPENSKFMTEKQFKNARAAENV